MRQTSVQFLWQDPSITRSFRTGVCLHGHTFHSEECLSFLPGYFQRLPGAGGIVRRQTRRVDFSRAYWTPPLTPASALALEQEQVVGLGLSPLVSLTDHDSIAAGLALQVACRRGEAPVSVEWTAPFEGSIFHIGVHNLPADSDGPWMRAMAEYTSAPTVARLSELLAGLDAIPDVLLVLNHPFWLEDGITQAVHAAALPALLRRCGQWLHALELNGTRPWKENRDTIALAREQGRPVISGGDRHACEPSACLNLTDAGEFAEFAAEVRNGRSTVLFLPQYREPMGARLLQTAWDILRRYPEYPDREHWTDRVYYRGEDGVARSLTALWKRRTPWPLAGAAGLVELFATTRLKQAIRLLVAERGESLL